MGLKLKKNRETRKSKRDLTFTLDTNTGKLFIEIKNISPQFRSAPVIFDINGDNETVDMDSEGKAVIEFEKQYPAVQYIIKIKSVGPLQDAQKLAFWY